MPIFTAEDMIKFARALAKFGSQCCSWDDGAAAKRCDRKIPKRKVRDQIPGVAQCVQIFLKVDAEERRQPRAKM